MDKYVRILRDNHIKVTPQRLEILRFLDKHHNHPTADMIYTELKKHNPALSKTTVYNSIDVLKEHDIIYALTIQSTESRYEIKHTMHHHFLCTQCGAIFDVEIECPNQDKLTHDGHKINEVHGYFKGICKKCQKTK